MSDSAPTTRERVVAYDLLRVFAAVTVVTIHVWAGYMHTNSSIPPTSVVHVFDQSLHFAVPLFTFLSGALSWGAVWTAGAGRYRAFMSRRWLTVGVPYVVWSILFYFLRPAGGVAAIPGNPLRAVKQFLVLLASGTTWFHLYFLPMILLLYLVTPLASRAVRKAPEVFLAAVYLGVVYGGPWLMSHYALLPLGRTLSPIVVPLLQSILTYVPFMALGAWFAVRQHAVGRAVRWLSLPMLAAAIAVITLCVRGPLNIGLLGPMSWYYVLTMSAFVIGFLGLALIVAEMPAFGAGSALADRVVTLASLTLGVYLVHPLVVVFVERKLVDALGYLFLWRYVSATVVFDVIAIAVSFGIAAALKRWKLTRHFV